MTIELIFLAMGKVVFSNLNEPTPFLLYDTSSVNKIQIEIRSSAYKNITLIT